MTRLDAVTRSRSCNGSAIAILIFNASRRLVFLLALIAISLAGIAAASSNAECLEATPRQALRIAAAVFRGTLVKIERIEPFDPVDRSTGKLALQKLQPGDPTIATFSVDGERNDSAFRFVG